MSNAKKITEGCSIPHTPGSAVDAGDVVLQTDLLGIATEDIAASALGSLQIEGIFELPKIAATVFTAGQIVYWDVASAEVQDTSDTGTNKQIGKTVQSELSAGATCRVKLIP